MALVGCGGRGTGAASDALSVKNGPIKLVAVADVFEVKLKAEPDRHRAEIRGPSRRAARSPVLGFRRVPEGDGLSAARRRRAVPATPPAFRWVHFTYAIEKGLNVFMEKPVCVDGPTGKRMLALGEQSLKKNRHKKAHPPPPPLF